MPKQDLPDDSSGHSLGAPGDLLPRLDCPFEIDFQALYRRLAEVPDEADALLKVVDGRRTLREALVAAGDATAAAAAARDLSELGVIRPIARVSGTESPTAISAKPAPASVSSKSAEAAGAPPLPPRIVRFPARHKRLPPPPSRLRSGPGDLAGAGFTNGVGVAGGAPGLQEGRSTSGARAASETIAVRLAREASDRAKGGVSASARRWIGFGASGGSAGRRHRLATAIVIAGALAAAVLSALLFMRSQ